MIKDKQTITGEIASWKLFDEHGTLKQEGFGPNLVTTLGKEQIALSIADGTGVPFTHMAIGSNSTIPAIGDTALGAELGRVAVTSTTALNNTVTYEATFGAGVGTGSVAEAGIFSASVAGIMLSRSTSLSLTKGASDTLQVTWIITFN